MKFFSLFENDEVHISPDKKIIPAKEFSKLVSAQNILKQTTQEALTFREDVTKECEALKEEAELAGFEEGLKRWNAQLALLDKEIKGVRQEIENSIVPLALAAVKKIIGQELEIHPEAIVDIVATALRAVSQHKKVKIFVSPQDLDHVEKARPKLKALFEHLESLTITPRNDIGEGDAVIETEVGIINARLDSQLKALESAFHTFFQSKTQKKE